MKYLLTLLLIVSLNVFSDPEGYGYCCRSEDAKVKIFINFDSLEVKGNKRKVWSVLNMIDKNNSTSSFRNLDEFDCDSRTYRTLSSERFSDWDLKGDRNSLPVTDKLNYIAPNTLDEGIFNIVCELIPNN